MLWPDIRHRYPQQWVLVEALQAHSEQGKRILDQLAVVDSFPDSVAAISAYRDWHRIDLNRELYVVHTSREDLDIQEWHWVGVRGMA